MAPQVSGLRAKAPQAVAEALANILTFASAQLNVVRNMNNAQIHILAADLLSTYWYFRLDEFLYVLRQGLRNQWGEKNRILDHFDSAVVHGWCKTYDDTERAAALKKEAEENAKQFRLAEEGREVRIQDMPRALALKALESQDDDELAQRLAYCEAHSDELTAGLVREVQEERARQARVTARLAAQRDEENRAKARRLLSDFAADQAEDVVYSEPDPETEAKAAEFFAKKPDVKKLPGLHTMKIVRNDENAA